MLQSGQTLDHFRIIKLLGAGGMGEVYLAEDTKLQRQVALKILLSEFFENAERKERFQREARTAAKISHQNVMAIYDIGSAPHPETGVEVGYIVMEHIEGKALSTYLKEELSDFNETIRLAEQIAAGLAAAHRINVVHRDIKAANIIIDADNHPKILDFGLAKPVAPLQKDDDSDDTASISQDLTQAGKIVGTISYMSPEQIRGEAVDNRSDIFSFGILLYRMVTGQSPFDGDTQVSTMAKILESSPESPRLKNEHIPAELERIIQKCLNKDPNDRYQDTRDLVVDLRNLRRQFDSGISSNISSFDNIAGKKKTGALNPMAKALMVILPLIVIVVAVLWQFMGDGGTPGGTLVLAGENGLAILGFENKTGSEELDWLQTGLPEILQTDLAESQTLNIISRDRVIDCLDREGGDPEGSYAHAECLRAAGSLGARHALSGTFYKLGDKIRIDARLEDLASGKIVLTEKVVGLDPFALVDSLTDKIALSLQLDTGNRTGTNVSAITSSSPEAYRIYLQGMEKLDLELTDEAIEIFERALAIDTTFALPYMRIAMAHIFSGRQQEAATWFGKAQAYRQKLPTWERNLLDIYVNLWLNKNFDDAFTQMKTLVENYPNDKETRTIYALLLYGFTKDTTSAFAQFDTALMFDPQYQLALTQYANTLMQENQFDRAIEYAERARKFHPESPSPYVILGNTYTQANNDDKAAETYRDLLRLVPGHSAALANLNRIYIFHRDFDEAAQYIEQIRLHHGDDPYKMSGYYEWKSNLAAWRGEFTKVIDYHHRSIEEILKTRDSTLISTTYSALSEIYVLLDKFDSAQYYGNLSYQWASLFQRIDYPYTMVRYRPELADSARPLFKASITELRSALPSEFWPLMDGIEEVFEASIIADTAAIIAGHQKIINAKVGTGSGELRTVAFLQAKTGDYDAAIEVLGPYLDDDTKSSSAFAYFSSLYYLGIAYEGRGDIEKAKKAYEKFLKYWGNADIEHKFITDVQERFGRLTT